MTQDMKWNYSEYPGGKQYPNLFKPITIGKLTIPMDIYELYIKWKKGEISDIKVYEEDFKDIDNGKIFMINSSIFNY